MEWRNAFKEGEEIILATCSKNCEPRAIVVISLGFYKDRLLIGACQMKKTLENLKENPKVSLVSMEKGKYYYRVNGVAEICKSGEFYEEGVKRGKKYPPIPHTIIVITINEVFNLDKLEKLL